MIRDRVTAMLATRAMKIVGHAETPQDAIDSILCADPDVVVQDVQLQGGSGPQVLRAVRQRQTRTAFVVFTNNAAPTYRQRYQNEGAQRFLDKSTEFDQLVNAVEQAAPRKAATSTRIHRRKERSVRPTTGRRSLRNVAWLPQRMLAELDAVHRATKTSLELRD